MSRNQSAALFVIYTVCLHGCATMVHGRTQIVTVDSSPHGAAVRIQHQTALAIQTDTAELTTPCQVVLNRKSSYVVHLKKEGYEPASVTLVSKASSSLWRNAVWIHPAGWAAGAIVDVSTGGGYDLEPEKVDVTLVPSPDANSNGPVEGGRALKPITK